MVYVVKLTQSFALEETMGKKCFMIGARGLSIAGEGKDTHGYWQWTAVPASRYVRTYVRIRSSINYHINVINHKSN